MRKTALLALVNIILIILICALVAQQFGFLPNFKGSTSISDPAFSDHIGAINVNASGVKFTTWELNTWLGIKNRLEVTKIDPAFTGNRTLQWISMRNSTSHDYYQKSMEFLSFWPGQGATVNGKP